MVFVSLTEALAVLPPVPVVGVSDGLALSLGVADGVAEALSLGVADGVAEALSLGVGDGLGDGVGVQATAGSAVTGVFFLDAVRG